MKKYIFVTGGVCSSLGKGLASASLGCLLEGRGLKVRMVKIDPYINVDAGTMSPYQHGEVYVTDDGAETDLDLGNYARYTHSALSKSNSITTGQIYKEVIEKERAGDYLGKTVQVIPHITDRIKQRIYSVGEKADVDVTIIEIGGTVGDIESIPFLEAARQVLHELGHKNAISVHLTLVPEVSNGELKTKPTQHSVKELREIGIQPDVLLARTPRTLDDDMRKKIALFTNVEFEGVFSAHDVENTVYEIPLAYQEQRLDEFVLKKLDLEPNSLDLRSWTTMVQTFIGAKEKIRIAVVGKYTKQADCYKSIDEALIHGGIANKVKVELVKIESDELEKDASLMTLLESVDGILVPGGFGSRGVTGMVEAAHYARTKQVPYFGVCLGMQIMVIEYARNVLGLKDADSTEFNQNCQHPVIALLEEQIDVVHYGGTMRLGLSESHLLENTKIREIYGKATVLERHRHRYEVSNKYKPQLEAGGLQIAALTPDGELVESVSWREHPWGIGVQYHPEFLSRPVEAHPLFSSFIAAAVERKRGKKKQIAQGDHA